MRQPSVLTWSGALGLFILIIFTSKTMYAQQNNTSLNPKEQQIVSIAAFTANGDLVQLRKALGLGLDAGLTINEIKEELVQLYAYCGFPRSLNGITTFMSVLDQRKAQNIKDVEGAKAVPVTGDQTKKYEQGRKMLEQLTGKPQTGPLTGANAFAPGIDSFLKEHLFADIFGRGVLSYPQRELATITVLATLPGLESQLEFHITAGMNVGLTESQLREAFSVLRKDIGAKQADMADKLLTKILKH